MFKLIHYTPEILGIARENRVDWDVAASMFLNNIHDVNVPEDPYAYHGSGLTPEEYAELNKVLIEEDRNDGEYMNEFRPVYDEHIETITDMWVNGKIDELRAFVLAL